MIKAIEERKKALNAAGGDWKEPYFALMRELYRQDVLLFALSKSAFDPITGMSTPLISTKDFDGAPALYVFSDTDTATVWMQHYQHVSEDLKFGLIGAIEKEDHDFLSVFQIAKSMGTQMIMLDEGGDYVGLGLDAFFEANGMDPTKIELPLSEEEIERMLENKESPAIRFSPVAAIPLGRP